MCIYELGYIRGFCCKHGLVRGVCWKASKHIEYWNEPCKSWAKKRHILVPKKVLQVLRIGYSLVPTIFSINGATPTAISFNMSCDCAVP